MRYAVERAWRAAAVGGLFAAFGIGSVLLSAAVVPLLSFAGGGDQAREDRAQRLVQRLFAIFVASARGLGIIDVFYEGVERLMGGPSLVIANHPTLLDVVLLVALLRG